MKIAFVSGICVPFDAISSVMRQSILWAGEAGHETLLFCHRCEFDDLEAVTAHSPGEVATHPFYRSADVVFFAMGIYYPLFGALITAPTSSRRLVRFHNVTPKSLVQSSQLEAIDKTIAQLSLLRFADSVLCDSQYNLDELRKLGLETPAAVRDLPLTIDVDPPLRKPSVDDNVLRIAFVGRFVRSKGPTELLTALDKALPDIRQDRVELDMIGNADFSDPDLLAQVKQLCAGLRRQSGGRLVARVHGSAPDAFRDETLRRSDLFLLPTYHEGFCVPVLESLASGCDVIAYDNSNVPHILGGLGTLVPTGDIDALAGAIRERAAVQAQPAWSAEGYPALTDAARRHVRRFDPEPIRDQFLRDLEGNDPPRSRRAGGRVALSR